MWKNKAKAWIKKHTPLALTMCTAFTLLGMAAVLALPVQGEKNVQQGIADEIIRFHVLANSDTTEDQDLKMAVKEEVVTYLQPLLSGAANVEETRRIIDSKIPAIKEKAQEVIQKEGYKYEADVQLTNCYFPVKSYGDCTFPAGDYEALRICIGEAKGHNWWCVLFPNLCFVDSLHAVVPEGQKQKLENVLTEEEYDSLFVRSKIWETVKGWVE